MVSINRARYMDVLATFPDDARAQVLDAMDYAERVGEAIASDVLAYVGIRLRMDPSLMSDALTLFREGARLSAERSGVPVPDATIESVASALYVVTSLDAMVLRQEDQKG